MAFSLNRIMLIGRLGKDAETRFTTNNVSVTNFTMATDYRYKGKNGDMFFGGINGLKLESRSLFQLKEVA